MRKADAIELLGGSAAAVASAIGITPQAVGQWPDPLTPRIADRVEAALARRRAAGVAVPPLPPAAVSDQGASAAA